MSSSMPGYSTVDQINFTGGFPSSKDLAPSIVFIILYAISLPILGWRIFSKRHRTIIIIRPTIFVICRLAMLILRAYMAKNNYGIGLLIAELVLVGVGYLFLLEPLSSLWRRLVDMSVPPPKPTWCRQIEIFMVIALFSAIACIAASGGLTSNAFESNGSLNTVIALRHASYCISLAVVCLNCIILAVTFFVLKLEPLQTLFLVPPHIALLIVGIYRVAQTYATNPASPVRTLAAFWIMEIFFEFVAYCFYISISIPEFFPKPHQDVPVVTEHAHQKMEGSDSNAERGQASGNRQGANAAPKKWQTMRVWGPISALIWLGYRIADK